jgi:hypothetical protein
MKEAHSEGFDFLIEHPTLSAVMNKMSKKFPAVPKRKQSIVSLERDYAGEEMNPLLTTALERHQWDRMTVHHFDVEQSIKFNLSNNEVFGNIDNLAVGPANPFGRFKPTRLNERVSGS